MSDSPPSRRTRSKASAAKVLEQDPQISKTATVTSSEVKSKKRKKRTKSDANQDEEPAGLALQNLGVKVGPKTTRQKILDLLNRHVKRKRPRAQKSSTSSIEHEEVVINSNDQSVQADYARFGNQELSDLLRDVGLNADGMAREELIKNCNIYHDLIIPPSQAQQQREPETSLPAPTRIAFPESTFDFDLDTESPNKQPSTSQLPSLEHGRFTHPRPRPTVVIPSSRVSRNIKGKGRARSCSGSEYDPMLEYVADSHGDNQDCTRDEPEVMIAAGDVVGEPEDEVVEAGRQDRMARSPSQAEHGDLDTDQEPAAKDTCRTTRSESTQFEELKNLILKTNKRVDILSNDLRTLTQIVNRLTDGGVGHGTTSKTRGGRTASCIRFHIDVMLGQKLETDALPTPAQSNEMEGWALENDLENLDVQRNVPVAVPEEHISDPCFPYPGGPGHRDATPQQLAVIWHMMNAVGVSSFRPDFTESASSDSNKWLWKLALKIFIKLVEYGEYTGVSLNEDNLQYIHKCFDTHLQTLKKRYREERWDQQRKAHSAAENKRGTRLSRIKTTREQIIISKPVLWPLLPVVRVACSDDETDTEPAVADSPVRQGQPVCVRKLQWRNGLLADIWTRIDQRKDRLDRSIPGASKTAIHGSRGRPSRPRIRRDDAPTSRIKVPEGLNFDCYEESIAQDPVKQRQLGILKDPLLPQIMTALNELGW